MVLQLRSLDRQSSHKSHEHSLLRANRCRRSSDLTGDFDTTGSQVYRRLQYLAASLHCRHVAVGDPLSSGSSSRDVAFPDRSREHAEADASYVT